MSNAQERRLDDEYESRNDAVSGDVPSGDLKPDNSYNPSSSSAAKGSNEVPVVPDDKTEDPTDISVSNTDAQLQRDENDAIDPSNIMKGRTRGAKPQTGNAYNEGPEEDDLPPEVTGGEVGTSDTTRSARNR